MKRRIPARAYDNLLLWAGKTKPGYRIFQSGREAFEHLKRLVEKPRHHRDHQNA